MFLLLLLLLLTKQGVSSPNTESTASVMDLSMNDDNSKITKYNTTVSTEITQK